MDINLLVVSVGNTRTALAAFVGGELSRVVRVGNDKPAELRAAVADIWGELKRFTDVEVAGATVNPPLIESIEHTVMEVTGESVQWVGKDLDLPIKVLTKQPDVTGIDRVLNVAAAYEQLSKACVVVDAGTALTISFCNDKGEFLGGAIAPGVQMQLRALNERTAKLPLITPAKPEGNFGDDTESAIRHGIFHGARGMVKELLENFATHLGTWPELIATGGDAELLFADWELTHAVSPDLTLYGVALAYTNHHIKHGA